MNILFLGGDKRYRYMIAECKKRQFNVYQIGFNNTEDVKELNIENINLSQFDIVIFPISGLNDKQEIKCENGTIYLSDKIFSNISEKTIFYTGIKTKKLLELIPEKQIISFLDYAEVKKVNDNLTVEGVMDDIKDKRKNSICILGYRESWKRNIFKIKTNEY